MYDYIIIGSGIAGLFTALLASKHGSVLLLTKAALEESNTRYAQGGIAAAISPSDSPRIHFEDTISAGAGLCDERAVEVLTKEAPGRIRDLLVLNVPFDRKDGELALGLEGAHRVRRVLHAGGDATGFHIEKTLCRALADAGVEVVESCFVTEILLESGRAVGVKTIDGQIPASESITTTYHGRRIVLASGGAGQLFSHTTNPAVATGDGLALAYRAGAELTDIEFYQFHPTALAIPGQPAFLLSEALRGEGAYLRNRDGVRFMQQVHPQAELAPRDVVSRAISAEMGKNGTTHVFLDLAHLPSEMIKRRFPTIYVYCRNAGLDMTVDPLPVAPAAHYLMGGVRTNLWGETNVPGLYACGEVACTGVHGANRLASNSLLEGLVFGARIVERTTNANFYTPSSVFSNALKVHDTEGFFTRELHTQKPSLKDLQDLMWNRVGLVRDEPGLSEARHKLSAWQNSLPKPRTPAEFELSNMILMGRLMAIAALQRKESRGGHWRSDFPVSDPNWQCHIVLAGAAAARSATEVR